MTITDIPKIYGSMVFNDKVMRERLPSDTYKELAQTVKEGRTLDLDIANIVAHEMKEWAIEHGATHFAHWFQPLTGITSEKHDSFMTPMPDGTAITKFSGKELIQGEPDASSFPSGGLRSTFEARGYTAWDPTSYAFIKAEVLCIPTAFCSYTGEALDEKTPLLRSMAALEKQSRRVLHYFGEGDKHVVTNVGGEQEYFLIAKKDYERRPDLIVTGRTLFGDAPCKGQELEEHYFGAIRPVVNDFMKELDKELWELGVSAKTKHNEVAPAQHELAPVYDIANRAIDGNLLTMEKMKLLASRHGLACLQHEKPFEGINGSGKHNNWSISAGGRNLLEPGDSPQDNLRFLIFLTCIIAAVDDYQGLLRLTVASCGNDHRLGANEAPPAIVSIFLGDELGEIVKDIITGQDYQSAERVSMDLGIDTLPNFLKDNTDRNRTSPFAFTGNKFEFRMPGSQQNLSDCNTVLNTAVAHSLMQFSDAMGNVSGADFEQKALRYIKQSLTDHQRIIFNGNGYSPEWPKEAARRGLVNNPTTADALPCLVSDKSYKLFAEQDVLNHNEVQSRYVVSLDKYTKQMNIECNVMQRMTRRMFMPAVSKYAGDTAAEINQIKDAASGADVSVQEDLLENLVAGMQRTSAALHALCDMHTKAESMNDAQKQADCYAHQVAPKMKALRKEVDGLEHITAHDYWPVPTYNDILFYQ